LAVNIDAYEDSKIYYYDKISTCEGKETDNVIYTVKFNYFVLSKGVKKKIIYEIAKARGEAKTEPFVILIPQKMIKRKIKNFTYPIFYLKNRVYIVPHLREILVYEAK